METLISKINLSGNPSCEAWDAITCGINPGVEIKAISVNSGVAFFLWVVV